MKPREFAVQVVRRLLDSGHQAVWAGGCVRDALLGLEPTDYDVATSATPEEVRVLFGKRQTLAIGEAFGVIAVLGPRSAGQIEVATFRQDLGYSDGRHPDAVAFSSAKEDSLRRDFTINGMFYDPISNQPIDYVGGQADLERRIIRAIGDPHARFKEDKLRMLRAVRFAATFDFQIEADTLSAIRSCPDDIRMVSAERIAAELRKMLTATSRVRAWRLLIHSRLLGALLPELSLDGEHPSANDTTSGVLAHLQSTEFGVVLAAIVRSSPTSQQLVDILSLRWKLPSRETKLAHWLLMNESMILTARQQPWPKLQRLLIHADIHSLMDYASAIAVVTGAGGEDVAYCRERLMLSSDRLNPAPLLDGNDLTRMQIPAGPIYQHILNGLRDAQLSDEVTDRAAAEDWVRGFVQR